MKRLNELYDIDNDMKIYSIHSDSRYVKPYSIFFCIEGLSVDGHRYIDDAIFQGAKVIVHSKELLNMASGAVYIRVEDVNDAMNKVARIFYAKPSDKLKMYGVTGTNGKSTITNIIRDMINDKTPCGYIGTIAIKYGDIELQPNLTTPDALFLQSKLADMVRVGMKACALEVSSHGLAQHRVDGISFDCAIFTNLTYDHLDFHGTMENYFEAKSLLFKNLVKENGVSVLNRDDEKYEAIKDCSKARVVSYGINQEADYRAINIKMSSQGTQFDLVYSGHMYPIKTNLVGNFNVYNLLAAVSALNETGYDLEKIIEKCSHIAQVEGRMERIDCGQPYNVIVDFAHTPDGMEKMMQFGRNITMPGHRLIAVFGSAGKRDVHKRKVFGELADKYCDYIIVTEDDPRDEDPKEIADQIKSGIQNTLHVFVQDRYEAIHQAISSAQEGDTVLLLGKGDESFIYRENGRAPWVGDNVAAKECIQANLG